MQELPLYHLEADLPATDLRTSFLQENQLIEELSSGGSYAFYRVLPAELMSRTLENHGSLVDNPGHRRKSRSAEAVCRVPEVPGPRFTPP